VVRLGDQLLVRAWIGRPLVVRFGKYVLITPHKLELAERWAAGNGLKGVFFARLLPVVRHLISIPAGILRMRFLPFSIVTVAGAGLWCWVLAWWGAACSATSPSCSRIPAAMVDVMKQKLYWFVGAALRWASCSGSRRAARVRTAAAAPYADRDAS
jgi:membrane protein DedA with SNARE-associated domain